MLYVIMIYSSFISWALNHDIFHSLKVNVYNKLVFVAGS